MLLQDEQYIVHWLTQYGPLPQTQIVSLLRHKPPEVAAKIIRGLKRQQMIFDIAGGYYLGVDPMGQPDQRIIHAVWVLLQFADKVEPMAHYPDNLWAELIGNADTQLMLGCTDDISAKYFSERSGDMTVEVNSVMTMRQSIAIAQVIPQYRYTEGLGRRRLLTPDEVLRLPNDELLIIVRSQDILKAKKFDYVDHPFAKEIKKVSIRDYRAAKPDPPVPPVPIPTPAIPSGGKPAATARRKAPLYESSKPPADF